RKNNVLWKALMQRLKMARHSAPPRQNQPLLRCVPFQKVMCLGERSDREWDTFVTALPVRAFVLPQPNVVNHRIAFEQIGEPSFEQIAGGPRLDESIRMRKRLRRQRANDLGWILIRLKTNPSANSKFARELESGPHHRGCAGCDIPRIGSQTRSVGPKRFRIEELRRANFERGGALRQISPARHGCVFERRAVTAPGKI